MDNKKTLQSNIWKFYLITAVGVRFIAPIRILYLISFGLSFAQIGIMELAAAVAIVILELPSGIYADVFGRKKSRLIAYFLSIAAFSLMSLGSTLPVFVIGWALSGAADAFQSGAQDALIFDTLKQLNREKDYIKMKSHFIFINTISVIIGSLVGSYLYTINIRYPWYLITLTIILSTGVFLTIQEPLFISKYNTIREHLNDFKKSLVISLSNFKVWRLVLLGLILALPMYVFTTLLNQPYLIEHNFSIQSLGIIFAVVFGISGLVGSFSHKIEPLLKQRLSFLLIIVSMAITLVFMGLIQSPIVLVLIIFFYVIDNFKSVVLDNYINLSISSESRATILSIQSFVNNIFISLLFVFIGYLVDILSINFVLIALGFFVIVFSLPLWLTFKHKKS